MKLKNFLCPNFKTKLIRVGRDNDGGYCISEEALKNTKILYSFGLADDWSFEENFLVKNKNTDIYVFDCSVNWKFWIKKLIKDFVELLKMKKTIKNFIKDFFCYFHYLIFFSKKRVTHIKQNIVEQNNNLSEDKNIQSSTMKSILSSYGKDKFFLKVDIEGNEYRILDAIVENQDGLECLAIEFHNIDLMEVHIRNFIKNFKLDLVHVHVNNFGGCNSQGYAKVVEATFSKNTYNQKRSNEEKIFPNPSIDQPNDKNKIEENIIFD